MKKILVFLIGVVCCFATSVSSFAQDANYEDVTIERQTWMTYNVRVLDNQGLPLIGANVIIKGTPIGSITDLYGVATIPGAPGAIIEVSYIGYQTQEIVLNSNTMILVVLQEDSELLDEVVVAK